MKRDHDDTSKDSSSSAGGSCGKSKLWDDNSSAAGMDELLAVFGYKVRSSDMADVALKIELLEMAMFNNGGGGGISLNGDVNGNTITNETAASSSLDDIFSYLSHLSSDSVHLNPSDISSWLQSMLSAIFISTPAWEQQWQRL